MTQDKHTPGPWRAGPHYRSIVADGLTGYDREDDVDSYCGHLVCESVKWDANARLIAAAPDMLEALRALMDLNDNGGPFGGEIYQDRIDRAWASARAAIAKATGDAQ